ncbi:DUF2141 domain-containing protein [Aquimarina algiphila]|uniref:DUF2141 domain-containing protein n=1 Tax=Aquimarina algiphila TaxID=2047982 RepID=UPI00233150F8|nr:DUF2141 domain-containing protein [Aquimarina algiphila]
MKITKFAFFLFVICSFNLGIAQELEGHTITVTINNIKSNEGTLRVGLYDAQESFLGKPFTSISAKAKVGKVTASFENIPNGTYAISLYHDEDNNQKLNTFLKIPTEPYGVSNNAKGRFGPPKWEDAKFKVTDRRVSQSISL